MPPLPFCYLRLQILQPIIRLPLCRIITRRIVRVVEVLEVQGSAYSIMEVQHHHTHVHPMHSAVSPTHMHDLFVKPIDEFPISYMVQRM